jgi:hypothetical protein
MQQFCTYGSVRGAPGNRCPYRDNHNARLRSRLCNSLNPMTEPRA